MLHAKRSLNSNHSPSLGTRALPEGIDFSDGTFALFPAGVHCWPLAVRVAVRSLLVSRLFLRGELPLPLLLTLPFRALL